MHPTATTNAGRRQVLLAAGLGLAALLVLLAVRVCCVDGI